MKKTAILFTGISFFTSSAIASNFSDEYILYCKGDKSIGFNWVNNKWEETRFYPTDHIVSKLKTNSCLEFYAHEPERSSVSSEVCINIREMGEQYAPNLSGKCTEFIAPEGALWSSYLKCEGLFTGIFLTKPDGWFHRATVHSQLEPVNNNKDSLLIEVGKCSRIK